MTADPLTAVLDQLAACREQLTQLADLITTAGQTLADDTAALARLEALDRQVTELADRLGGPGAGGTDGHRPSPAPAWQSLTPAERKPAIAGLRAWVDQVYRPGYGHLAATLGPCWPAHDLCLYGLDILSQLWRALYLQPARSTSLLSAQAEYQARILPALAAQLMTETTGCNHNPARSYAWSTP